MVPGSRSTSTALGTYLPPPASLQQTLIRSNWAERVSGGGDGDGDYVDNEDGDYDDDGDDHEDDNEDDENDDDFFFK